MRSVGNRIIIYRLGSLGDTVAALPCFHLIERAYPESERVALTNVQISSKASPLDTVLKAGGFIDRSISYPIGLRHPRRLARLAAELRAQRAHTLIYLAESRGLAVAWRDVGFFKLCGFKKIIGAPLTQDLQANRTDLAGNVEREAERLVRTIRPLGTIDLDDRGWWDLRLTEEEHAVAFEELRDLSGANLLAVNTGGKVAEKDWGTDRWRVLLQSLGASLVGWGLVFVGGREDQERAAELSAAWPGPTLDLCGRLSPRESAAALSRAALFVGHDSGPVHLADAVGIPALGLFGGYNRPQKWHPVGPSTRVIHRMSGMADIAPGDVVTEARDLLAFRPGDNGCHHAESSRDDRRRNARAYLNDAPRPR